MGICEGQCPHKKVLSMDQVSSKIYQFAKKKSKPISSSFEALQSALLQFRG